MRGQNGPFTARAYRRWNLMGRARSFLRASGGHGLWIAFWSVVGWVGTVTAPFLLDEPFLLMALAPRTAFVVLAAPTVGLFWFVLLGTLRLSITDANWFLVGRRMPELSSLHRRAEEDDAPPRWRVPLRVSSTMVKWLCRSAPLAGLVLFLRPNGKYLGVAGAFGVGPRVAGISSVTGTIVYLIAVHIGVAELLF